MKIPLFDLDKTLIENTGNPVGVVSFSYAIEKVFDKKIDLKKISMAGMIDSQILIELSVLHGIQRHDAENKLSEMFLFMEEYFLEHEHEGHYNPMPGALELLEKLSNRNIPMAVLTGNFESKGWKKLERSGLKKFFTTGAFGNMALKRSDLIPIALEKLQLECDEQIQKGNLVIIGDTPLDIRCAKEQNIYSIGVAAGKHSKDDLAKEGADFIVDSLVQKDEIFDYLIK